jgi:glycosyltransferase involved in cell wall biosynthesis
MLNGRKIVVVLPAYNAGKTLERTYHEIPRDIVDEVILVDDRSRDDTLEAAARLGIPTVVHDRNRGYGANQKTCYTEALRLGADIVVMLHPDYQYPPGLVAPMAAMVVSGMFDVVLGSRILGGHALRGGMPIYRYVSNRFLTAARGLRRLRLRQRDSDADLLLRVPRRRDHRALQLRRRLLIDQLRAQRRLRAGCAGHHVPLLASCARFPARPALRPRAGTPPGRLTAAGLPDWKDPVRRPTHGRSSA